MRFNSDLPWDIKPADLGLPNLLLQECASTQIIPLCLQSQSISAKMTQPKAFLFSPLLMGLNTHHAPNAFEPLFTIAATSPLEPLRSTGATPPLLSRLCCGRENRASYLLQVLT